MNKLYPGAQEALAGLLARNALARGTFRSVAGTLLPVSQRVAAGHVGQPLQPGTAARIFTGAQIPPGADAVVPQEQCEPEGEGVRIGIVPSPGQWIRRRGEDVMHGAEVLPRGTRLTPQALGLAASVGAATLSVSRRPRVALFSTGDELVMPGQPLPPGAIYNSNRFMLRGLLQAAGCEVVDLGIVPDRLDATRSALRRAAVGNDLILTSGGVSAGEEDHIKPALRAEGWLESWQVAIKPGKPLVFGAVRRAESASSALRRAESASSALRRAGFDGAGEALFIGLPGNPVSSFVTFLLVVAPLLRALQGSLSKHPGALPPALLARADFDWPRPDRRREFLRARLNGDGGVELFPNQSSGVLTSAVWADGLVDLPAGQSVRRGDSVRVLPLSSLIGA